MVMFLSWAELFKYLALYAFDLNLFLREWNYTEKRKKHCIQYKFIWTNPMKTSIHPSLQNKKCIAFWFSG